MTKLVSLFLFCLFFGSVSFAAVSDDVAVLFPGLVTADDVAVRGSTVFVAGDNLGISSVDISDQANPRLLGSGNVIFNGEKIALSGNLALVSGIKKLNSAIQSGYDALYIYDVSDPVKPKVLGKTEFGFENKIGGLAVNGNIVYVALGSGGIGVIDISDPANPSVLTITQIATKAYDIAVFGDNIFVANGPDGLLILDISDTRNPRQVDPNDSSKGKLNVDSHVWSVAVVGGEMAYLSANNSFFAVNVADKKNPAIIGSFTGGFPFSFQHAKIIGRHAFVAGAAGGMTIFDISDPARLTRLPVSVPPAGNSSSQTVRLDASGTALFTANRSGGLGIINISNPSAPFLTKSFSKANNVSTINSGQQLMFLTGIAGGTSNTGILKIFRPSDSIQLSELADLSNPPNLFYGSAAKGNYAFIASEKAGVKVVDATDPLNPRHITTFDTPGFAFGVATSGNFAYISDGAEGLRIIDISNPASPKNIDSANPSKGTIKINANVRSVAVDGDLAYIAGASQLNIIDISDKANPVKIGNYTTGYPFSFLQVRVKDKKAYLSGSGGGFIILDVQNPRTPVLISSGPPVGGTGAITRDIDVFASRMYVANSIGGIAIYDISDISNPRLEKIIPATGAADIEILGDDLYIADLYLGLLRAKIEISPPLPLPLAPGNASATQITQSIVELLWKDNSTNETNFKIERSATGNGNWNIVAQLSANTATYVDRAAQVLSQQYYRVGACNANGCSPSAVLQVEPFPPSIEAETDSDNDSIPNSFDKCPSTRTTVPKNQINVFGCPIPIATKFDIKSNFNNEDLTDIEAMEIGIAQYGKITYANQNIRLVREVSNEQDQLNLDNDIQIQQNRITVNSTNLTALNKPATITLYNVAATNPIIKRDGVVCLQCQIVSYNRNTRVLVFTVPGF